MRIVYFGTAEFAVPALEAMSSHIALVVSQPARPSGRGLKLTPSPVEACANRLCLPVATPERCRAPEFVEQVRAIGADFLLVAAYGQILPLTLLEAAQNGAINLHGSILPRYRGAAPIQRAILNGDSETGVTLMQMDKGMDTGDIIAISTTPIGAEETAGQLTPRLAALAAVLAAEWGPKLAYGDYLRVPQDDSLATLAPKVERGEARLDVNRSAMNEFNRYRAFTPNPGAYLETVHGALKVHLAELVSTHAPEPGFAAKGKGMLLGFKDGALDLIEVQPAGKPKMTGAAYANGLRIGSASERLVRNLQGL